MSETLWHLWDETTTGETSASWASYCGARGATIGSPHDATCPKCIDLYETRPQPVTTADLLELLNVARKLAHEGSPRTGPSWANELAHKLEQRLRRPRRVKPEG